MNPENNQLAKLNKDLTNNFQERLKQNQLNLSCCYREESIFGLWSEIKTSLSENETGINFESAMKKIIHCPHSFYEINWAELVDFIKEIETLSQQKALISFSTTLKSTANNYQNLIQTMENQFTKQISHEERKNHDLQAKITAFELAAQRLLAIQERIHHNNQYLPSQERVSLENLRFKFELLSQQAQTQQAQQALLKQHCHDLENSLAIIEANLQIQQQNFINADARWKAAEIKLLQAKVNETYLASVREGLEQANERINQHYLTEAYNVTKLTDLLIRLEELIFASEQDHSVQVQTLKAQLVETIGELRVNQEDLEKLTKINFLNKVKLSVILALDTSRSFLPSWYGQTLTSLETTILVGQVTQSSLLENTTWILLFFFALCSFVHSFSKLCQFLYRKLNNKPNQPKRIAENKPLIPQANNNSDILPPNSH